MNTTIERLEQIESERMQTMSDPAFHNWMKNLNVSQSYEDPEGKLKARDMMASYGQPKKRGIFYLNEDR